MDLRKINTLIDYDYTKNSNPVSTYQTQHNTWQVIPSSASSIAPKRISVCRLRTNGLWKWSHSILLAERRTFAYRRLAQGLSRSFSAFSTFMRENLDPFVKADQCGQDKDNFRIAAIFATDLTRNLWAVFEWTHKAVLKLTIEKCHFEV